MRLIDADELVPNSEWDDWFGCFSSYSQDLIDKAPTVEAIPILSDKRNFSNRIQPCGRAEWYDQYYICQKCGCHFMVRNFYWQTAIPNYCPHCGSPGEEKKE